MQEDLVRFYGRRKARPLKTAQKKLLETLASFEIPLSLIESKKEKKEIISLQEIYQGPAAKIVLEIGFGGGEHIAQLAECHPENLYIGCEVFINGVASLLGHIEEKSLPNIRIFPNDARLLIPLLEPNNIDEIYLMFPDPWPKTRHHKRRFIQKSMLELFKRILKPSGLFQFASDNIDLINWVIQHIHEDSRFEWMNNIPPQWFEKPKDSPQTRYEQKAILQGIKPNYFIFQIH